MSPRRSMATLTIVESRIVMTAPQTTTAAAASTGRPSSRITAGHPASTARGGPVRLDTPSSVRCSRDHSAMELERSLLDAIAAGEIDDHLDALAAAVNARRG